MDSLELFTVVAGSAGAVVGLSTLTLACFEYRRAGRTDRAKLFFELRARLKADPLGQIADLIDVAGKDDDEGARARAALRDFPRQAKRDYLSLFEEVSLMIEWGLVQRDVAHYTFGYYAILCWESNAFWTEDMNKITPYRARFQSFYIAMKKQSELEMERTTIRGEAHVKSH